LTFSPGPGFGILRYATAYIPVGISLRRGDYRGSNDWSNIHQSFKIASLIKNE